MPTLDIVLAEVARFAPGALSTVDPDCDLVSDLGYDSVRLVELMIVLGDRFAQQLPVEAILSGPVLSPRRLTSFIVVSDTVP